MRSAVREAGWWRRRRWFRFCDEDFRCSEDLTRRLEGGATRGEAVAGLVNKERADERGEHSRSCETEIRAGSEASGRGRDGVLRGRRGVERVRSHYEEFIRRSAEVRATRGSGGGFAGVRESHGAGEIAGGRGGSGSGVWRRD